MFHNVEMPTHYCLALLELNGIGFSTEECEAQKHVMQAKLKDLESQARNTKHLMDKLNRAAYGMTFDEAIRLGKENPPPCSEHDEGKD